MNKPALATDVFLQPGEFHFSNKNTRIRTILGSCVSITMWHPSLHIGGMCHYMLPSRNNKRIARLDGRYGDEAILMFFEQAIRHESDPAAYQVKVFGGGNMFPQQHQRPCLGRSCDDVIKSCRDVSCKNLIQGVSLLEKFGFQIASKDLGGATSRNIIFDVRDGHVWVRRNTPMK